MPNLGGGVWTKTLWYSRGTSLSHMGEVLFLWPPAPTHTERQRKDVFFASLIEG